jgi:hypothetical protein
MQNRWGPGIAAFATFQAADALACLKLDYIQKDLDRLNCPPRVQRLLPFIKAASALGLLVGRRWPRLGRFTAVALSAYFAFAIGFHLRAKDPAWRSLPAASLLAVSLVVGLRGYQDGQLVGQERVSPFSETIIESTDTTPVEVIDRQPEPAEITN